MLDDVDAAATPAHKTDHRLHGEIGWLTPAERYDGTPFTDRGFDNIPPLRDVAALLADLLRAA